MSKSTKISLDYHSRVMKAVRLPTLSYDALTCIISFVNDNKDLKNVRLSSRDLASIAAPSLFENITLLPQRDFLQGFATFMEQNANLAQQVRFVRYDVDMRYVGKLPATPRIPGYNDFMVAVRRQALTEKDTKEELSLPADCLRVLPSLRKISVDEIEFEFAGAISLISEHHHRYYRQLLGSRRPEVWSQNSVARKAVTAGAQIAMLALSQGSSPAVIEDFVMVDADPYNLFAKDTEDSSNRVLITESSSGI